MPKKKLVFCPPSNSKRSLFEGMILKEKLKNFWSRWASHRFMLMKTYYLGKWDNSRCCWNPRFWPHTRWFKLTKKLRDKSLRLRKKRCHRAEDTSKGWGLWRGFIIFIYFNVQPWFQWGRISIKPVSHYCFTWCSTSDAYGRSSYFTCHWEGFIWETFYGSRRISSL